MAVDSAIVELMNETVTWEKAVTRDRYAQNSFAAPVTIKCFIEPSGFIGGGIKSSRRPDETVVDAVFEMYFDASDPNVQQFTLDDYFTVTNEAGVTVVRTQPELVANFFGPNGDPWLKVVTL